MNVTPIPNTDGLYLSNDLDIDSRNALAKVRLDREKFYSREDYFLTSFHPNDDLDAEASGIYIALEEFPHLINHLQQIWDSHQLRECEECKAKKITIKTGDQNLCVDCAPELLPA